MTEETMQPTIARSLALRARASASATTATLLAPAIAATAQETPAACQE